MKKLPDGLGRRTHAEDVAEDVGAARGTNMSARAAILEALCRMAAEQIAQHPDPQKTLAWQDPLSPATERLLASLRARYRVRD